MAAIPVFLLLYYFWCRDQGEKEPLHLMRKVFLWGILAIIPVFGIEMAIDTTLHAIWPVLPPWFTWFTPFIFIAWPEEYFKFLVVKKVAYDHHKFNEIMDGIHYCVIASLGFALFENIIYTYEYGLQTGVLRAMTAVPAHALFSGMMGYYLGQAKFSKSLKTEKSFLLKALLAGIFFHGLYDFLLLSGVPFLIFLVFPLLFYMWTLLHHGIRFAHGKETEGLEYF